MMSKIINLQQIFYGHNGQKYKILAQSPDLSDNFINKVISAVSSRLRKRSGVEVLWDDREKVSPGFMFSDADLFGVPVRVVVSPKGLKNGTIEISARDKSMKEIKPIEEAVDFVYNYVVDELAKLECRL